jgi:hypothetical protein
MALKLECSKCSHLMSLCRWWAYHCSPKSANACQLRFSRRFTLQARNACRLTTSSAVGAGCRSARGSSRAAVMVVSCGTRCVHGPEVQPDPYPVVSAGCRGACKEARAHAQRRTAARRHTDEAPDTCAGAFAMYLLDACATRGCWVITDTAAGRTLHDLRL